MENLEKLADQIISFIDMKRNKGEGTQGTKAGVVGLLQNFIQNKCSTGVKNENTYNYISSDNR